MPYCDAGPHRQKRGIAFNVALIWVFGILSAVPITSQFGIVQSDQEVIHF